MTLHGLAFSSPSLTLKKGEPVNFMTQVKKNISASRTHRIVIGPAWGPKRSANLSREVLEGGKR